MLVATLLEAADSHTEWLVHLSGDKEDTMQMIGHHLEGYDFDFWMMPGEGHELIADCFSQRAQLATGCIRAGGGGIGMAHHAAEKGTACFGGHRHHIHLAAGIVVIEHAARHLLTLLSGKGFMAFVSFTFHLIASSDS